MRLIFAGTPEVAVPTLEVLAESEHEVVAVLTRPPARSGRGRTLIDSPVARVAKDRGLRIIETSHPRDPEIQQAVRDLSADLGVVVAFGAIIPPDMLAMPAMGWINLHFSDLPRWRGAAPVQHAIRSGDQTTATCVFHLEQGLDTGPILSRLKVALSGSETTDALLASLAKTGSTQVLEVIDQLAAGTALAVPQSEDGITLAPRLSKDDAYVDFRQTCAQVDAWIRSVTSNPGAWTLVDGTVLRLDPVMPLPDALSPGVGRIVATKRSVRVGCERGMVELTRVAPAGKGWMDAAAWWRGARLTEEAMLGGKRGE